MRNGMPNADDVIAKNNVFLLFPVCCPFFRASRPRPRHFPLFCARLGRVLTCPRYSPVSLRFEAASTAPFVIAHCYPIIHYSIVIARLPDKAPFPVVVFPVVVGQRGLIQPHCRVGVGRKPMGFALWMDAKMLTLTAEALGNGDARHRRRCTPFRILHSRARSLQGARPTRTKTRVHAREDSVVRSRTAGSRRDKESCAGVDEVGLTIAIVRSSAGSPARAAPRLRSGSGWSMA